MRIDDFRVYMDAHENEMLEDLKALIEIPSERMEAQPGKPFGPEAAKALEKAGEIMARCGLKVRNYDNYVVAGDLNELDKRLDILAHLDVVPAGEGWTITDAFTPLIADGKIFGRGAIDDKGPAIAAVYAMRAVRELGIPLKGNVRLVLGSDEECGSSDLDYYYERESEAPLTFSPDGDFPVINVEKGGLHSSFTKSFASQPLCKTDGGVRLIRVDAGTKINVVPGKAKALVAGMAKEALAALGAQVTKETGVDFYITDRDDITDKVYITDTDDIADRDASEGVSGVEITAKGRFAHAASPETGNNALTALLTLLSRLPLEDKALREGLCFISSLYPHGDCFGQALGVAMADEVSGSLTMSLNMMSLKDNILTAAFDCRAPLCADDGNTRAVIARKLAEGGFILDNREMYPAHYVPADSAFVQTLLGCYKAVTGIDGKPLAIGGGTYVHDLKSGVAFGCCVEGVDNHMHGADEFMDIARLKECAVIFAEAIVRLCKEEMEG